MNEVEAAVDKALEHFSRIDILVNGKLFIINRPLPTKAIAPMLAIRSWES